MSKMKRVYYALRIRLTRNFLENSDKAQTPGERNFKTGMLFIRILLSRGKHVLPDV